MPRYVCPENPKNLGTRLVADLAADFLVECVSDAEFAAVGRTDWPKCREPLICPADQVKRQGREYYFLPPACRGRPCRSG